MDTSAHRLLIRIRSDLVDGLLPGRAVDEHRLNDDQVVAIQKVANDLWRILNDDPQPPECQNCATALEHAPTGRPRRYCSDACRQQDARSLSS
jgi:hypothetical protein